MLSTTAWAQNSVDDMIDEFSHIGSAEFTSAIKRNEKTHAVEKVVKIRRAAITKAYKRLQERGRKAQCHDQAFRR
jgi:hypothetical protein